MRTEAGRSEPEASAASATRLLQLMQLASPALPVGGFSYSEGLEAAVDAGLVADEAGAGDWLIDQLQLSLQRSDMPVLAAALPAWRCGDIDRLQSLNEWVAATRESAESRQQTLQMGRSLNEWLKNRSGVDERVSQLAALPPSPTWPLAFALATAQAGAHVTEALLTFGFGWAENMVQAAMRAVPLGQAAAQRMLARLIDALPAAVESAATIGDEQRQAFTPMMAILGARHETQYSRLFRS